MKEYFNLLKEIVVDGVKTESSRDGLPDTYSLFDREIRITDCRVPILTGKKVLIDNVISELCWFLHGDTNIKYLLKYNNNIWNQDAYRYYREKGGNYSFEEWINKIKNSPNTSLGECGNIYGYQWRRQHKKIDQIKNLVDNLINNPFSRYHIVDSWNWLDYLNNNKALPACHNFFQCRVTQDKNNDYILDLSVWQRSCDMFLGVPYNLLSYSILHELLCKITDYKKGVFTWHGGDCHIYENQMQAVDKYFKQYKNKPINKVEIEINPKLIYNNSIDYILDNISPDDIKIINYESMPFIKGELNTGVNKFINNN